MSRFDDLTPEEQAEYRVAAQQMLRLAGSYAVPIIFGEPAWAHRQISGATGAVLSIGPRHVVLTASHVLAGYESFISEHSAYVWQVGNFGFDPLPRVIARDMHADIVALEISSDEARGIGTTVASVPHGWPPPAVAVGQAVFTSGYPKILRDISAPGRIGSDPLSMLLRVDSIGDDYFYCQVEPQELIPFNDNAVFAAGTDLGGWSGSPILLMGPLSYPIVGIVSEFQGSFGLLRAASLSALSALN
jgi:hypothetical protein